ncbi:MAG: redoxin domain-containing protein [Candidatus Micrarchaeota archaeon]
MVDTFIAKIPAREFQGITSWINSGPISIKDLKGKVVLLEFWTYTCINCLRTLSHVKGWHEKYSKDGLVVIGVHSPEFEFEKSVANVKKAVERLGIRYPVAVDSDMSSYDAYDAQCWPARFMIDKEGFLCYVQFGEGNYSQTETEIQTQLGVSKKMEKEEYSGYMFDQSPEEYAGFAKNSGIGSGLACDKDGCNVYIDPGPHERDVIYPHGRWVQEKDYLELKKAPGKVSYRFNAREANVVLVPLGNPVKADVFINEKKIGEVTVDSPRMYTVFRDKDYAIRELALIFNGPVRVYAFTFG